MGIFSANHTNTKKFYFKASDFFTGNCITSEISPLEKFKKCILTVEAFFEEIHNVWHSFSGPHNSRTTARRASSDVGFDEVISAQKHTFVSCQSEPQEIQYFPTLCELWSNFDK